MNILYIEHYAGTPSLGMEYRPYYFAREWIRMGHTVRIIASSFSHYRANQPLVKSSRSLFTHEVIDGIEYEWIHTPEYAGNGIGRVRNIAVFLSRLHRMTRRIIRDFNPTIVIASSTYPMDMYVARHIAKVSGAKLLFELHDLWPLSPIELGGISKYHPFMMLCQHAENYAYRHADAVVSILPNVHDHVVRHGLSVEKLHIIPNGTNSDEWIVDESAVPTELLGKFHQWRQGRFVVGYAGQHGLANALDTFIQAGRRMPHIGFVLIGHGSEKERLQRDAERCDNILFLDAVSKKAIPYLLSQMDALYLGWKRSPLYRFGISPNKLIDYMMAGKPIIHAVDAGNDDVAEAGCGISIEPENTEALCTAIQILTQYAPDKLKIMGENGRLFVLQYREYRVLAKRFVSVMQSL